MAERQPSESAAASHFQLDCCVICKEGFCNDKPTTVSEKGIMTLVRFSEERGCSELHAHLTECVKKTPTQAVFVHKDYRRDFTNRRRPVCCNVSENDQLPPAKKLRSSMLPFDWKKNCMLCGNVAQFNARHPERDRVYNVTTLPMRDKLLECCIKRGDAWASDVQNRLHGCIDLVAAEAIYHTNCYSRFC